MVGLGHETSWMLHDYLGGAKLFDSSVFVDELQMPGQSRELSCVILSDMEESRAVSVRFFAIAQNDIRRTIHVQLVGIIRGKHHPYIVINTAQESDRFFLYLILSY